MGNKSSKVYCVSDEASGSIPHSPLRGVIDEFVNDRVHSVVTHTMGSNANTVNNEFTDLCEAGERENRTAAPAVVERSVIETFSNQSPLASISASSSYNHTVGSYSGHGKSSLGLGNRRMMKKLASAKSLTSFAMKQHLKQDNHYMPTEEVSASVIVQLHKLSNGTNNSSWNSLSATGDTGSSRHSISGTTNKARDSRSDSHSDQNLLNAIAEYESLGLDSPEVSHVKHINGSGDNSNNSNPLTSFISSHASPGSTSSTRSNRHVNLMNSYLEQKSEKRKRENEKAEIQDDADWIPVSDDEDEGTTPAVDSFSGFVVAVSLDSGDHSMSASADVSVRIPSSVPEGTGADGGSSSLSLEGNAPLHVSISAAIPNPLQNNLQSKHALQSNQSYMFTKSGTMLVDGLGATIGKTGLHAGGGSNRTRVTKSSVLSHGSGGSGGSGSNLQLQLPMKERLVVLCRLGNGASGIVYKALDLTTMRFVALKIVPVFERAKRKQMTRELTTLFHMLRHVNSSAVNNPKALAVYENQSKYPYEFIVSFFDAFSVIDEGGVALMMEYMDGGSLQDIVDIGGCDDEETLGSIALQSVLGLKFLHDCKQIHRDLKPGNLLINKRGDVKVADLGILKQLDEVEDDKSSGSASGIVDNVKDGLAAGRPNLQRTNTFVGTATYMSPERIDGKDYSYPSDIWALGLAILAVATGKTPIQASGGYWSVLQAIRDEPSPLLPPNTVTSEEEKIAAQLSIDPTVSSPVFWSDEFRDFIGHCLQKNPDDRLSCNDLLKHPFLQRAIEKQSEQNSASQGAGDVELYFDEDGAKHYHRSSSLVAFAAEVSNDGVVSAIPSPPSNGVDSDSDDEELGDNMGNVGGDGVYREHVRKSLEEVDDMVKALYEHLVKLCRDIVHEYKEERQGHVLLTRVSEEIGNGSEMSSPVDKKDNSPLPNNIVVAPKMPFKMAPLQLPGVSAVDTGADQIENTDSGIKDTSADVCAATDTPSAPLPNVIVVAPKMPFKMAPLQLPGVSVVDTGADFSQSSSSHSLQKPNPSASPNIPQGQVALPFALTQPVGVSTSTAHMCIFDRAAVCAKWHAHYLELHYPLGGPATNFFLGSDLEEEILLRNDLVSVIRCIFLGTRGLSHEPSGGSMYPISEGSDRIEKDTGSQSFQSGSRSESDSQMDPSAVVSTLIHPSLYASLAAPPSMTVVGPPSHSGSTVKTVQVPDGTERVFALSKQLYVPTSAIVQRIHDLCNGMVITPEESLREAPKVAASMSSFLQSTPKAYHSSGKHAQ